MIVSWPYGTCTIRPYWSHVHSYDEITTVQYGALDTRSWCMHY